MALEDRQEIIACVEETYALMGRAIGAFWPETVVIEAMRPDVLQQIRTAQTLPFVVDPEMRELFQAAYADLRSTLDDLRGRLLGSQGQLYDEPLATVALTGPGRVLKVRGFRRSLSRWLETGSIWRWFNKTLEWANVILGSLGNVPGVGVFADPIRELKEAIEAQGDDDQNPS